MPGGAAGVGSASPVNRPQASMTHMVSPSNRVLAMAPTPGRNTRPQITQHPPERTLSEETTLPMARILQR